MQDKKFIGKVTARQTQYGEMISISFGDRDRKDLEATKSASGWNNLTLKKGKAGNYYLEVFEGKAAGAPPSAPQAAAPQPAPLPSATPADDLPF